MRGSMPDLLIVAHQQPDNLLPRYGPLVLDFLCLAQRQVGRCGRGRLASKNAGSGGDAPVHT